jgi:pantoate--beta-alanine ligase
MQIAHSIEDLRRLLKPAKQRTFVPTMGNLHAGHLELVKVAKQTLPDAMSVASIFVNRLQFAPHEDFDSYPRTFANDCALLEAQGCDVLFAPQEKDLYPEPQVFKVHPPAELADILEGAFRPGFFVGVSTVVHKLFNCVQPDVAVFGKKDYQQLIVIKRMVQQMALPIQIVGVDTLRADDGLALSSRNGYLSADERARAVELSGALKQMAANVRSNLSRNLSGEASKVIAQIEEQAMQSLRDKGWQPDYLVVRHQHDLLAVTQFSDAPLVVLGAARLGSTRLIDNLEI